MRRLQANMRGLSYCTKCRREIGWCSQYYIDTRTKKLYCLECNARSNLLYIIISEWRRMIYHKVFHIPYYIRNVIRRYMGVDDD